MNRLGCLIVLLVCAFLSGLVAAESHLPVTEDSAPSPPTLTTGSAAPGGVAVVPIEIAGGEQPAARFGDRDLMIVYHEARWYALVGLGSRILPGNYIVNTFSDRDDASSVEFAVLATAPGLTETGSLRSIDQSIGQDSGGTAAIDDKPGVGSGTINPFVRPIDSDGFTPFSNATPDLDLRPVVESLDIVPFGSLLVSGRIMRHDYLRYHTRPDAQVYAPTAGIVQAIVNDGAGRETLYLDHGKGLISILGNLINPMVAVGQVVQPGEQLATVGNAEANESGAIDWGLQLNGWLVDPAAIIRLGEIFSATTR